MSQVITNAFEHYWQSSLAAEQPVVLDEFILADIPNLDITSPIDPDAGLPPESQIVHRQNVDQRGRINNNAVAYTIVMDTTVGDFSFNAMYLRNKQNGVIGMIVYKGRETKLKTDQTTGQTGNSLVKSMLMGYDQAAEATLTHVDAGTWQIDYAARLRGQDEDLRQLASQLYGHHTFIGDGFKVVQQDGGHQVTQGVAIVGGLRIELKQPQVIYPGTKPIGVWVDVHRAGSLLSEHQNHFTIITSVADLTDHVDGSGYQHYVAKLGTVQADNSVVDGRGNTGGGGSSIPDALARLEQADDKLAINNREAIRRSYAEVGYHVVGTFEAGFTYVNANDVGIHEATGKGYTGPAGNVDAGTNPEAGPFVSVSNNYCGTVKDVQAAIALAPKAGSRMRIAARNYALFEAKSGTSLYPLVNPQLEAGLYLALKMENGEISTTGAGATDYDDTFILNQLIQYGKSINAAVKVDCNLTLRTPFDAHTFIRLPQDFTIYSLNPRLYRITIRAQSGVTRDAGLCLESFAGLNGPEPAMCSGTVCQDIYINADSTDGGVVKVGHCIIGAMFRTMFIRPYASGFSRHNILLCRAWYATIEGLFGRAGKGCGVTIGKHPDVNQAWDGAVNGIEIDQVWGHTNGQDGTWVANTAEDIGYGVGLYGQMFSVHIGKVIAEANQGSGFQNKISYGDFKIDTMYLETNLGYDYYSAITNSAGISWQTPCVFLSKNADVKVKPDSNTTASLIGFPFVISGNTFDFTGVNFANLKLSRQTAYSVRNTLGPIMSNDFKIVSSEDGNLNSSTVVCKGPNPVSSLEFNNNVELIFIPYQTTTSTDQFVYQITKDGVDQGTTLGKAGPFTAYQPVKLTSWSGSYDAFYSFRVLDTYSETCPGRFVMRARHL
ncbi:hypothetical protein A051pD_gene0014 [Aeromonas phage A051]|uniref:Phage tail fibre protein N-terminal domain-containing protein n=1 Tax=Aeromonas phage A051 TaxID=2985286 RepID=A0A9X9P0L3_9CAUD|nr:hypothetical protein A051pD_gene0014 [Aeromonas phage A051]